MDKFKWICAFKDHWIIVLLSAGIVTSSIYLRRIPLYTRSDLETLYILFVLFALTAGLQKHRILAEFARKIEQGTYIPVKLVVTTFFFSMLVTNDVALLAIVPLTLSLRVEKIEWLVIMEALAANAGSALSPLGNPQNLFLYWYYKIPFWLFIKTIAPFSALFLVLIIAWTFMFHSKKNNEIPVTSAGKDKINFSPIGYFYIGAWLIFIPVILRVLPPALGGMIILFIVIIEKGKIRLDYALLITIGLFFGFTYNLQELLSTVLAHPHHVFLTSSLLSQVISNVPAALVVSKFTPHWQALLWGVSVGGFGSLFGSLANLIAFRLYRKERENKSDFFLLKFHTAGFVAFFLGWIAYFLFMSVTA